MTLRQLSERHESVLRELSEERVAALTRISRTLESLIEQLQALATDSAARGTGHYQQLRERAKQYRWYLEVQREALGIRNHRFLDEVYKIPT